MSTFPFNCYLAVKMSKVSASHSGDVYLPIFLSGGVFHEWKHWDGSGREDRRHTPRFEGEGCPSKLCYRCPSTFSFCAAKVRAMAGIGGIVRLSISLHLPLPGPSRLFLVSRERWPKCEFRVWQVLFCGRNAHGLLAKILNASIAASNCEPMRYK